jgi:hypothetical protein
MGTNPKTIHPATSGKACFSESFFTKLYYAVLNITGVKINVCKNTTTLQTEFPWFWKTV